MKNALSMTAAAAAAALLQSCPTLWDPIDGSPPGSPVPGILKARALEWVELWLALSKFHQYYISLLWFKKKKNLPP